MQVQNVSTPKDLTKACIAVAAWSLIFSFIYTYHFLSEYFLNKVPTGGLTLTSETSSSFKRCTRELIQTAGIQLSFRWSHTQLRFINCIVVKCIRSFILDHMNIKCTDKHGWTLLHKNAIKGLTDIVYILLNKGASVHAIDNFGCTPLHYAASNGHSDIVKMLLDKGASIDAADNVGRTPLHDSALEGCTAVVVILLERGASPNTVDISGKSPLHYSAMRNHALCSRHLILCGGLLDATDNVGNTPQTFAYRKFYKHPVQSTKNKASNILSAFTHGMLCFKEMSTADLGKVASSVAFWILLTILHTENMSDLLHKTLAFRLGLLLFNLTCAVGQVDRKISRLSNMFSQTKDATSDQIPDTHDSLKIKKCIRQCILHYIFPTGFSVVLNICRVSHITGFILTLAAHVISMACIVSKGSDAIPTARRFHKPAAGATQAISTRTSPMQDVTSAVHTRVPMDRSTLEATQETSSTSTSTKQGTDAPDCHLIASVLEANVQKAACDSLQQLFTDSSERCQTHSSFNINRPPESGGPIIVAITVNCSVNNQTVVMDTQGLQCQQANIDHVENLAINGIINKHVF